MSNTIFIKALTFLHGDDIINWFKTQGVDTRCIKCNYAEQYEHKYIYYGVVNGYFSSYSLEQLNNWYNTNQINYKIVTLESLIEETYPIF